MVDYFKVLEIPQTANFADIKRAYHQLALKWHPDKNPEDLEEATKKFKEICEAYETLSNEFKKPMFDILGRARGPTFGYNLHDAHFKRHAFFTFRNPDEGYRDYLSGPSKYNSFGFPYMGGIRPQFKVFNQMDRQSHPFREDSPLIVALIEMGFTSLMRILFLNNLYFNIRENTQNVNPTTNIDFIKGKKITTKKISGGGTEIELIYENDIITSVTLNGIAQRLRS